MLLLLFSLCSWRGGGGEMELYFAFSAMWMFSTHTDSYIYYYRTFSLFVPNIL